MWTGLPVGGSRQSDTLGADRQREDLANDNPRGWTPGRGKEEDVDAREDDQAGARGLGALSGSANDSDDELADEHTEGAVDQESATAELLNGPEGDGRGANVDGSGDHGNQERVLQTDGLEEGRAVVLVRGQHVLRVSRRRRGLRRQN
jgi:hypothetical protein